jgi:predicted anti-sigma-YlaC factor YlaD
MMDSHSHDPSMLDCEAAARSLYDYLDGHASAAQAALVDLHIATCQQCASHYHFAREVLRLLPSAVPLATDHAALRARVIGALAEQGLLSSER